MKNGLPWLLAATMAGYMIVRYQGERGGATDAEVHASLPGDNVIPHPMVETTHSISIDAPPSVVWQWLIQAGYRDSGRAGWYSDSLFDVLNEGIFLRATVPSAVMRGKRGTRSAAEILPQFQQTAVGDIVPDGPPGTAYFVVKAVEPERTWVLYSDTHLQYASPNFLRGTSLESNGDFTWVFVLNPIDDAGTRLILRTRGRLEPRLTRELFLPVFYLAECIIPRQILCGIKSRAERLPSRSGEPAAPAGA